MSAGTPLLEAEGLAKQYGGTRVLSDVGLSIASGEIRALIGHNGSGKSTLIKVLAGVVRPEPGARVRLDGEEVALGHRRSAGHGRLHFIHQSLNLVPELTGSENLGLGGLYPTRAGMVDWRRHERNAHLVLDRLGVEVELRTPVRDLSPVQQATIAVARAVSRWSSPRSILVLDEPTAALPEPEVDRLLSMLRTLAADGAGILYVSHRLEEVVELADTVTVLREGRVVEDRVTQGDLTERDLVHLMLGTEIPQPSAVSRAAGPVEETAVLRVDGLSGGTLRELSLSLAPGEVLGIAGLDGSGREALGRLVFGADERVSGSVQMSGRTVRPSPRSSVAAGLAFVPADRGRDGCIPSFSVTHNVTLTGLRVHTRWGALRGRRERAEVRGLMTAVALRPPEIDRPIGAFSGGNQQKAVIAKWLRLDPRVLFIEEPAQGVDVGARDAIFALIAESVKTGMGVVVSSAAAEDLAQLCDRVLVLRRGRVGCELAGADASVHRINAECLAV